jgi:epoxyqueuosine reductase QueG
MGNSQPIPLYDVPDPEPESTAEEVLAGPIDGPEMSGSPSSDSPEDDVKSFALKRGAIVVGIADAEAIKQYAPEGHQPSDLMQDARSVIVIGTEPLLAGGWRTTNPRMMGVLGSFKLKKLKQIAISLAEYIEHHYQYYAIDYNTYTMATGSWDPVLSIKLCAELAGLGTRSLAGGMILNPEWGFLYYSLVVTSMPLSADGPMTEPACPAPSCVDMWRERGTVPCLNICPMCLSGAIDDAGRIEYWEYDRVRCSTRADYTRVGFQKLLYQAIEEPDADKRKMILLGSDMTRYVAAIGYATEIAGECFECIRVCPVGAQHRIKK